MASSGTLKSEEKCLAAHPAATLDGTQSGCRSKQSPLPARKQTDTFGWSHASRDVLESALLRGSCTVDTLAPDDDKRSSSEDCSPPAARCRRLHSERISIHRSRPAPAPDQ